MTLTETFEKFEKLSWIGKVGVAIGGVFFMLAVTTPLRSKPDYRPDPIETAYKAAKARLKISDCDAEMGRLLREGATRGGCTARQMYALQDIEDTHGLLKKYPETAGPHPEQYFVNKYPDTLR